MTKDEQIEEMAKILAKSDDCGDCMNCIHSSWCPDNSDATALYNAGYRKASEILEEIEEHASITIDEFGFPEFFRIPCDEFTALKKKYTEGKG